MTRKVVLLSRRVFLAALAGVAACSPQPAAREAPPAAPAPEVAPGPVVTILGDSITAGLGLTAAEAFPAQLQRALREQGLEAEVRAAGVSGDTTAGGLGRLEFSVADDTDLCVVALGANDMFQTVDPARVRANLDEIITRLKGRGIEVLLAGMRAPPQYGAYAAEFDRVFPDLAAKHDLAFYPFLLEGVALERNLNQADGIHPNAAGARRIAEGLAPVVAAALSD